MALAILGACAHTAMAQSAIDIYGIVDMGFVHDSGGNSAGAVNGLGSGVQSGSRLGFKGREDLGGGLAAIFKLEQGILMDTGTSDQGGLLFGREAFVGLQGGFGAIKLGRQYNPLYNGRLIYDPFESGFTGDFARVVLNGGKRVNNSVVYVTPSGLGGFNAEAQYGFGEQPGDNAKGRQYGLALGYSNGPLNIRLGHDALNNVPAAGAAVVTTRSTALGGNYDFTILKAYAMVQVNKSTAATALDTRDYLLGVSVPFGDSALLGSYIHHQNKAVANADSNQIAIGYTYALSKRTNLYTSYSRLANDSRAKIQTDKLGATDKLFAVGLRHLF
jgi:predicted porin